MRGRSLSAFRLGLYFTGCFLGAGFLSGKEIWNFFGNSGLTGLICIIPSFTLIALVAFVILKLVSVKGTRSAEELVLPFRSFAAKTVFTFIQAVFLFGIAVIMVAGASALGTQLFSLPALAGGVVFCLVTVLCSAAGVRSVIRVFSCTVPVLAAFVCVLCILCCASLDGVPVLPGSGQSRAWSSLFAALLYASYNLFGSVPLIAAVSDRIKNRRSQSWGLIWGTLLMILIAVCVYLCQAVIPSVTAEELPLLAVAQSFGSITGILFGMLLLCAMFGTALSTLVAANDMLAIKWPATGKRPYLLACVEFLLLLSGSFLGFGNLITLVYPAFGYAGILLILLLTVSFIRAKRKKA